MRQGDIVPRTRPYDRAEMTVVAVLPGPWGPIHLAVRDGAIAGLELLTTEETFVRGLLRRLGAPLVAIEVASAAERALVQRIGEAIDAALAGDSRPHGLPFDLTGCSAWDRAVLGAVATIPFGAVTSYGRLARMADRPGAARAVGGAVGRSPIGLLLPCHRVIAGDGSLGGYGGDERGDRAERLGLKRELLLREGVVLPARELFGPPA